MKEKNTGFLLGRAAEEQRGMASGVQQDWGKEGEVVFRLQDGSEVPCAN